MATDNDWPSDNICWCCGDLIEDGLFPIKGLKEHDCSHGDDCDGDQVLWCGICWEEGSCKGPYDGGCYKMEHEEWWWRCFNCLRLCYPIPKEEPETGSMIICEDCLGDETEE